MTIHIHRIIAHGPRVTERLQKREAILSELSRSQMQTRPANENPEPKKGKWWVYV